MACPEQEFEVVTEVERLIHDISHQLSNVSFEEANRKAKIYNRQHFAGNNVITVERSTTERGGRPYVDYNKEAKFKAIQDKIISDNKKQEQLELQERVEELREGRNLEEDFMPNTTPPPFIPGNIAPPAFDSEPFKYGNALSKKQLFRERLIARRNLLENREKTKENLTQLAEVKNLLNNLYKDIEALRAKNNVDKMLDDYLDNATVDMGYIKALLRNPTMDNIQIIGEYLEVLDSMVSTGTGNFLEESLEEMETNIAEAKKNKETDRAKELQEVLDKLKGLRTEIGSLKAEFEDKNELIVLKAIESHIQNIDESVEWEEKELQKEARRLYENQIAKTPGMNKDLKVGKYFTTLDGHEEDNVIMSVIYKIHADALKMTNVKRLSQEALNIKDKLIRELEKNGETKGKRFRKEPNFDIFRRSGSNYQLIGKFSNFWDNFLKARKQEQEEISKFIYNPNITPQQIKQIKDNFKELSRDTEFLDVNSISEIVNDPDFAEFSEYFNTSEKERDEKRAEIIGKIGEREYKKIVKRQKENIYAFQTFIESSENRLRMKYDLEVNDNIQDNIPEKEWNMHLHYVYSKSPFALSKALKERNSNVIEKVYYVNGEKQTVKNSYADLEYATYFPKSARFFDGDFRKIEENEVYNKAWGTLADLNDYITANGYNKDPDGLNEHSLAFQRKEVKTLQGKFIKFFSLSTLRNLHKAFTTERHKSRDEDTNIAGGLRTVDEHIEDVVKRKVAIKFPGKNATKEEMNQLRKEAKEEVLEHQNENIFDNILSHSEIVSKFKAAREIESKVLFFENWFKENANHPDLAELIDYFIDKNMYGINNKENWNEEGLLAKFGAHDKMTKLNSLKWYSDHEKEVRAETKKAIKSLVDYQNTAGLEAAEIKRVQKEIDSFNKYLESGGQYVTPGSILEASLVKITRFGAFALNFKAQTNNMIIGRATAMAVDGREGFWKAGVYDKAYHLLDKRRIPFRSKRDKKTVDIIDLILGGSDLFQNSANEMIKIEKTRGVSTFQAIVENPMNTVAEVEKYIQRPQIISLMSGIEIKGKDSNGNEISTPMFVADPAKGESHFPAFDIKDGNLTLSEKYETPENRETFIEFRSQRFANLFGDAGEIPTKISYINGNYKDTNVYLFQKQQMTSIPMMFKTWMPATYKKYYGALGNLGDKESGGLARNAMLMKAAAFGANFGMMPGIGAAALGIAFTLHANKKGNARTRNEMKADATKLQQAFYTFKNIFTGMQLANLRGGGGIKNTVNLGVASLYQTISSLDPTRFFRGGERLWDSDAVKARMSVRAEKSDGTPMTEEEIRSVKDDLFMLSTVLAKSLQFMAFRYLVMAMLAPGEEEEEMYKKMVAEGKGKPLIDLWNMELNFENKFWDRFSTDPDTTMYYILENMFSAVISDANIMVNLDGTKRLAETGYLKDMGTLVNDVYQGAAKGNWTLGDGPNRGRNRFWSHLQSMYMPSAVKGGGSLGFESVSNKDFDTNNLIDEAGMSLLDRVNKARLIARKEEKYKLRGEGLTDKQIDKELKKKFPVIKEKHINSKGELYKGDKDLYEHYWSPLF